MALNISGVNEILKTFYTKELIQSRVMNELRWTPSELDDGGFSVFTFRGMKVLCPVCDAPMACDAWADLLTCGCGAEIPYEELLDRMPNDIEALARVINDIFCEEVEKARWAT